MKGFGGRKIMALRINRRRQSKADRISSEWSGVADAVFDALGVTRERLMDLEYELLGRIVLPGMTDYDTCREPVGLCPDLALPLIIVYCRAPNDVRLCLAWAHERNWWVTCRSGGHSTAGYSANSGLVIDVSEIAYVSVDPSAKRARVGAGTQFHELNSVLDSHGLHVPGGTCPDVAVAGYMQGGGYGLTSLMFGMNCDQVIELRVMLADGRIVTANDSTNPDLFWAMGGGTGNNFGLLLEITYRLVELPELWGFCLQWPLEHAAAVLFELQNRYMRNAVPAGLGYEPLIVTIDGSPALLVPGMHLGARTAALEALAPLRDIGNCELRIDTRGSYAKLNDSIFALLPEIPAGRVREVKRGGYISASLQPADWEQVARYFATAPNPLNMAVIEPYGGAIARIDPSASAFIHRSPYMDFFVDSFFEGGGEASAQTDAQAWLDGFMDLMRPHFNGHMYQNYPVPGFADFRWAYWGDAFNSLLFVKQKYDPGNFFHFEQSIEAYPSSDDQAIRRTVVPSMFSDPSIDFG
jgi:FAD/FMN-containing dehydrogenase